MSPFHILMILAPPVALFILGVVSIRLTGNDFFKTRRSAGWALMGVALAIFFPAVSWMGMSMGAIFYAVFLSMILALQGPLMLELVTLALMGDRSAGLKLLKSYSMAERNIIEDDLSGSIAEYESAVAEDPDDVEARLRLAEVSFQNAEYRKTVEAYEAALHRGKKLSAERKCLILTRLAQIHAEQFGEPDKARRLLETIIKKYPNTRFSEYAQERMAGL